MTVSLGDLALADDLTLTISSAGVAYSQRRLLGGGSVVQAEANSGGRTMTLAGEHHWTLAQVETLRSLEAQGQPLTLVHHRGTYTVLIIDTAELTPSIDYANPQATDWYSGAITMIEV